MAVILGVDPGLNTTGWGVVRSDGNSIKFIGCGAIKTKSNTPIPQRLREIFESLKAVIDEYKPDKAALEEVFVNMNSLSSMKLTKARAASMLAMATNDLEISEYSTRYVKKVITGSGSADKLQMMKMLGILMPGLDITQHDEADAVAVAVCKALERK